MVEQDPVEKYFDDMLKEQMEDLELLKENNFMATHLIARGYAENVKDANCKTYTKSFERGYSLCFYRESYVRRLYGGKIDKILRDWRVIATIQDTVELDIHIGRDEVCFSVDEIENMFEMMANGLKNVNLLERKT